jgi:hypothetical protein
VACRLPGSQHLRRRDHQRRHLPVGWRPPASSPPPSMTWAAHESSAPIQLPTAHRTTIMRRINTDGRRSWPRPYRRIRRGRYSGTQSHSVIGRAVCGPFSWPPSPVTNDRQEALVAGSRTEPARSHSRPHRRSSRKMRSLGPGPEIASQPVPSVSPRLTRDHQPRGVAPERRASGASEAPFTTPLTTRS